MLKKNVSPRQVFVLEMIIILFFSALPLLTDLPFRVNIFLTWEGAYRMYLGQLPFRDFGMPLGYGFWIIPCLFFKVFGPYLYTLVLTQAFINVVTLFSFRSILKLFGLGTVQILLSVLVFCLSFVMINFWPWYNNTVFAFELVGLYFIVRFLTGDRRIIFLALGAFFAALCFVTKQDAGGLALMLMLTLITINSAVENKYLPVFIYLGFYILAIFILVVPFLKYDFGYWFNYGQQPHFSRLNLYDFLTAFFVESLWLKLYIACIIITCMARYKTLKAFVNDKSFLLFTMFTLGILVQATIIQVTSFSPVTVNYYFHSFAIAFMLYSLKDHIHFERIWVAVALVMIIFIWRSENYWKYSNRLLGKFLPSVFSPPPAGAISKNTWSSKKDSVKFEPNKMTLTSYRTLKKIKLPVNTANGLDRIMKMDVIKNKKDLKVLNMSNLSMLAYELGYAPDNGMKFPLWYHQGVAFFDREEQMLCENIRNQKYDMILFEDLPEVDNFFPYAVRDCALEDARYKLVDRFVSPTGYVTDSVNVYIKTP